MPGVSFGLRLSEFECFFTFLTPFPSLVWPLLLTAGLWFFPGVGIGAPALHSLSNSLFASVSPFLSPPPCLASPFPLRALFLPLLPWFAWALGFRSWAAVACSAPIPCVFAFLRRCLHHRPFSLWPRLSPPVSPSVSLLPLAPLRCIRQLSALHFHHLLLPTLFPSRAAVSLHPGLSACVVRHWPIMGFVLPVRLALPFLPSLLSLPFSPSAGLTFPVARLGLSVPLFPAFGTPSLLRYIYLTFFVFRGPRRFHLPLFVLLWPPGGFPPTCLPRAPRLCAFV